MAVYTVVSSYGHAEQAQVMWLSDKNLDTWKRMDRLTARQPDEGTDHEWSKIYQAW
jgi:hypothetical protein